MATRARVKEVFAGPGSTVEVSHADGTSETYWIAAPSVTHPDWTRHIYQTYEDRPGTLGDQVILPSGSTAYCRPSRFIQEIRRLRKRGIIR